MKYYPVFIDLKKKLSLVIGGGSVASRKVEQLLKAGARVRVISPELSELLREKLERGEIEYLQREYQRGDLEGVFLAIAATDDYRLNAQIAGEAEERGVLFNAVDQPELCNFIVPSIVERGDLLIAISTSGSSPSLAKKIRVWLEGIISQDISILLQQLKSRRKSLLSSGVSPLSDREYLELIEQLGDYLED